MLKLKKKTARTKKGLRVLRDREPQEVEEVKRALVVRGHRTSGVVNDLLSDLSLLKKPNSVSLRHKNEVLPFEDDEPIQTLSQKHDASLFVLGNHNKKRPNNLVIGRMFSHQLLEMYEFGVSGYVPIHHFKSSFAFDSKPCLLLMGDLWDLDSTYRAVANVLVDFFRGRLVEKVDLVGLDRVVVLTAPPTPGRPIHVRHYAILLRRSGQRMPLVELELIGPSFDLTLRRLRLPSNDLWSLAVKQPRRSTPHKQKNVTREFLGTFGTVHLEHQDTGDLQTRKIKALKRKRRAEREMAAAGRRSGGGVDADGDGGGDFSDAADSFAVEADFDDARESASRKKAKATKSKSRTK
jgi:ribosome production factor 2